MENKQLQLVNFEQAERLDKAGFDWDTLSRYDYSCRMITETNTPRNHNDKNKWTNKDKRGCSAPTVALALKWMRNVKGIYGAITRDESGWYFTTHNRTGDTVKFFDDETWPTYEAAESALLDELQTIIDNQ